MIRHFTYHFLYKFFTSIVYLITSVCKLVYPLLFLFFLFNYNSLSQRSIQRQFTWNSTYYLKFVKLGFLTDSKFKIETCFRRKLAQFVLKIVYFRSFGLVQNLYSYTSVEQRNSGCVCCFENNPFSHYVLNNRTHSDVFTPNLCVT